MRIRLDLDLIAAALLLLACAAAMPRAAQADDCSGQSVQHVRVEGADVDVLVRHVRSRPGWEMRVREVGGGFRTVALPEIPDHAHLIVFIPRGASRIAVVRTGAEHDRARRVLIYDLSGRLERSLDLSDMMSPAALRAVTMSISHIQWLSPNGWRFRPDGHTVELRPIAGPAYPLRLEAVSR